MNPKSKLGMMMAIRSYQETQCLTSYPFAKQHEIWMTNDHNLKFWMKMIETFKLHRWQSFICCLFFFADFFRLFCFFPSTFTDLISKRGQQWRDRNDNKMLQWDVEGKVFDPNNPPINTQTRPIFVCIYIDTNTNDRVSISRPLLLGSIHV